MVHLWEDDSDWSLGEPTAVETNLEQRGLAGEDLNEDELVDVLCQVAPELALHRLLSEFIQTEEDSEDDEAEMLAAPGSPRARAWKFSWCAELQVIVKKGGKNSEIGLFRGRRKER